MPHTFYSVSMKEEAARRNAVEDYNRVERAIRFLEQNFRRQPDLAETAAAVNLSPYHFHRLFKRWAGVTPLQFLQYLTIAYAKERLRQSHSIFAVSLEAGLSSGSRLHDLFVTFKAMTPGEYKKLGEKITIAYGFHGTPFGQCLLAMTERGICALRFVPSAVRNEALAHLKSEWPRARFVERPDRTAAVVHELFSSNARAKAFHLHLKGTNFQVQVWQALLAIPPGAMVSYQDVATGLQAPTATRAVASAIARNPVAYLIPCHRVISKAGKAHNYRWGAARKKAMLGWEASHCRRVVR